MPRPWGLARATGRVARLFRRPAAQPVDDVEYPVQACRPAAVSTSNPALLEALVPGRPDLRAQELYARSHEWARTDEDVLRRRTTAWLGIRVPA